MGREGRGRMGEGRVYMYTEAGFLLTISRTTPEPAQGKHVCL